MKYISTSKFKAASLRLLQEVASKGSEYIITKRSIPIAKLTSIKQKDIPLFGKMKGTLHTKGDIMAPIDQKWDANG